MKDYHHTYVTIGTMIDAPKDFFYKCKISPQKLRIIETLHSPNYPDNVIEALGLFQTVYIREGVIRTWCHYPLEAWDEIEIGINKDNDENDLFSSLSFYVALKGGYDFCTSRSIDHANLTLRPVYRDKRMKNYAATYVTIGTVVDGTKEFLDKCKESPQKATIRSIIDVTSFPYNMYDADGVLQTIYLEQGRINTWCRYPLAENDEIEIGMKQNNYKEEITISLKGAYELCGMRSTDSSKLTTSAPYMVEAPIFA